jgi:polyphosphate glucokinase
MSSKVLVIDVGGTNIKILVSGQTEPRRLPSGPAMTAAAMAEGVRKLAEGWEYDVVAIGYPGVVENDQPVTEPANLAPGWVRFDYSGAFDRPVKIVNDAAMQALGSYHKDKMLFLGLGTGLGSTLIVHGTLVPMELAHLPYRKGTFEDYVGERALVRDGKRKWRKSVFDVVARLKAALVPDDVVIGGGNVKNLTELPPGCRAGDNANAFVGGYRLWATHPAAKTPGARKPAAKPRSAKKVVPRKPAAAPVTA